MSSISFFKYLGNADIWLQEESDGEISLGTSIASTVTERPLADGRALIHINVHARDILAWVTIVEDYYLNPLIFEYRARDVLAGAPPAHGDLRLKVKFISPEQNAPILDLFQLLLFSEPGQDVLHVSVNMSATGILHEGTGYSEGTFGRVQAEQIYSHMPEGDYTPMGWTLECIDIRPIGN